MYGKGRKLEMNARFDARFEVKKCELAAYQCPPGGTLKFKMTGLINKSER